MNNLNKTQANKTSKLFYDKVTLGTKQQKMERKNPEKKRCANY